MLDYRISNTDKGIAISFDAVIDKLVIDILNKNYHNSLHINIEDQELIKQRLLLKIKGSSIEFKHVSTLQKKTIYDYLYYGTDYYRIKYYLYEELLELLRIFYIEHYHYYKISKKPDYNAQVNKNDWRSYLSENKFFNENKFDQLDESCIFHQLLKALDVPDFAIEGYSLDQESFLSISALFYELIREKINHESKSTYSYKELFWDIKHFVDAVKYFKQHHDINLIVEYDGQLNIDNKKTKLNISRIEEIIHQHIQSLGFRFYHYLLFTKLSQPILFFRSHENKISEPDASQIEALGLALQYASLYKNSHISNALDEQISEKALLLITHYASLLQIYHRSEHDEQRDYNTYVATNDPTTKIQYLSIIRNQYIFHQQVYRTSQVQSDSLLEQLSILKLYLSKYPAEQNNNLEQELNFIILLFNHYTHGYYKNVDLNRISFYLGVSTKELINIINKLTNKSVKFVPNLSPLFHLVNLPYNSAM